jgi:hypothetical protein
VLYTINVFIVFATSILGLSRYWWLQRYSNSQWLRRFVLSTLAAFVCSVILLIVLITRFLDSGWMALLITGSVIAFCLWIRRHYQSVEAQLTKVDQILIRPLSQTSPDRLHLNPDLPTAVFLQGRNRGTGMHTLLTVQRLFPGHYKNFIFLSAGLVDVRSYGGQELLQALQKSVRETLQYFVRFSEIHGIAAAAHDVYGTDLVDELCHRAEKIHQSFPNSIFFASQLVLNQDTWFSRLLHSATAFSLQRRLHALGIKVVILPMKLDTESNAFLS